MCIQANNFLGGMYLAYGWPSRHVNIIAHEICEVWNNDYGKWIYMDGYFVNHYLFDKATGEPLSILEAHERLLDFRWPGKSIDWMKDDMSWGDVKEEDLPVGLGVPGSSVSIARTRETGSGPARAYLAELPIGTNTQISTTIIRIWPGRRVFPGSLLSLVRIGSTLLITSQS